MESPLLGIFMHDSQGGKWIKGKGCLKCLKTAAFSDHRFMGRGGPER